MYLNINIHIYNSLNVLVTKFSHRKKMEPEMKYEIKCVVFDIYSKKFIDISSVD